MAESWGDGWSPVSIACHGNVHDRLHNAFLRGRRFTLVAAIAMSALVTELLRQARGATAIEYAFVASLISIAIYTVAITVGSDLSGTFNSVATKL